MKAIAFIVFALMLVACVPAPSQQPEPQPAPVAPAPVKEAEPVRLPQDAGPLRDPRCPASCDDANSCTQDVCNLQTDFECRHAPINPCCGNGVCEAGEDGISCSADCAGGSALFAEIIKNSGRVESVEYHYEYYDAEALTETYDVKIAGNITQVIFDKLLSESDGFSYNKVMINDTGRYAVFFCNPNCGTLKSPARFSKDYARYEQIRPLDILHSMVNVTVVGEENVEGKAGTVLEEKLPGGGTRRVKVWTFYGVPMLVERYDDSGTLVSKVRYRSMAVNAVREADLAPPKNAEYQ